MFNNGNYTFALQEGGLFDSLHLCEGTKVFHYYYRGEGSPAIIYQPADDDKLYIDTSHDIDNTCVDIPRKELRLYKGVRELHYIGEL